MNRIPRSRSQLALVPAFAAFLVMQACGGSDDAVAQEAMADPIEGVWEGAVTIRDCTTSQRHAPALDLRQRHGDPRPVARRRDGRIGPGGARAVTIADFALSPPASG